MQSLKRVMYSYYWALNGEDGGNLNLSAICEDVLGR